MIEMTGVCKRFGDQTVLDGVNLTIRQGETMALLGYSGAGKSVLLKHINGLLHPDSGKIVVDGLVVSDLLRNELAALRNGIGYVFQNGALFDSETVFENIKLGITDETCAADRAFCRNRVSECLNLVNLPIETGNKFPSELSGGMKKRVGIARAIAGEPKYLLYDEPTSGLDPVNADIIDSLISKLQNELGVTSMMVTHDVRGGFRVADRLALLHEGIIRAVGTPEEFANSDDVAVEQFLDRDFGMKTGEYKIVK